MNRPTRSQPSNSYAATNGEKTHNKTNDITDTNCNTAPSKRNGQHQCQTSPPRNNNTPNGTTNPHHTRPTRTAQKDHPRAKDQPDNRAAPRPRNHTKQHTGTVTKT
eukprot:CAMPEP_0118720424 /NCGR_PEP_ID=MMETSP0800-20121206/30100_1 /TAXON_ID=210618 ORGANISM="Striatella unipunctata, Strain CCMP2910" /NCGR_SAMPLE_ID=MMETSP0800 /ASSEMBLY_ACC=CAM_ASM_000638 /LENGTH=105 /DNA_ID=CAMNT_0006628057 /DNA_START=289 /DNA_END=602 /DNA_ORIENTATION=-